MTSRFARHAADGSLAAAADAHRTSRAYGTASVLVPGIGFALAARIEVFDQPWVQWSIGLFVIGALVLAVGHLPAQRDALAKLEENDAVPSPLLGRLRATAGIYATSWVVIAWLMIAKPT